MTKEKFINKLENVYVGDKDAFYEVLQAYINTQNKIDKAIKYINNTTTFCVNGEIKNLKDEIIGIKLLTILQDEKVK